MSANLDRRKFLVSAAAAGSMLGLAASTRAEERAEKSAANTLVVGVMGVNGRGSDLAGGFAGLPGVEVGYICDVDERAIGKGLARVAERQTRKPAEVKDFRKILDDPAVDALLVAAPDHWHGPATILACAAGKHVYVEKPCSHNPHEGEAMVAAARKHQRAVQVGTQRRSYPGIIEAVEKLRAGAIGKVLFARAWYNNQRPSIGHGKTGAPPAWLDFDLWQGPAPARPFRDNLVHYNWHWFWHWGTGELGNNGVHGIDICRWGLGVDYPRRVTSAGGKYRWDDDQETPDTQVATFEFDGCSLVWEGRSWSPRGFEGDTFGMSFYGEQGSLVVRDAGYKIYDLKNRETAAGGGSGAEGQHFANFVDCIRNGGRPHADIEEGHKTTLLCHLGNISQRVGRALTIDPKTGRIVDDAEAQKLWRREYQAGWEVEG